MNFTEFRIRDEDGEIISSRNINLFRPAPIISLDYLQDKSVKIGYIESPSFFNIHQIKNICYLENLQNSMQLYYTKNFKNLKIPRNMLSNSLNCVFFDEITNIWMKGRTKSLCEITGMLEIQHSDISRISHVKETNVCFLLKKFSIIPEHSTNCRLSNIIPENSKFWTKNCVEFFKDEISLNNHFHIDIHKEINGTLYVNLNYNDSMSNMQNLIVQKGYARYQHDFASYYPSDN